MLATTDSSLPVAAGRAGEDHALPHVGAEQVEPPVAVEVDERARSRPPASAGISGIVRPCRVNWRGDSAGSGHGSGQRQALGRVGLT